MLPKAGIEYVLGMKLWSEDWWRWVRTVFQAKQVTSLPDTLTRAGHSLCGHAEAQIRAIRTACVGLGGGVEPHTALLCAVLLLLDKSCWCGGQQEITGRRARFVSLVPLHSDKLGDRRHLGDFLSCKLLLNRSAPRCCHSRGI